MRIPLCLLVLIGLTGCIPGYRPGGAVQSFDEYTYLSTEQNPQTVKLVEWSTNSTIWTLDVPVGKQLVMKFYEDHDPKNTTRPALMRWEIMPAGQMYGELHNSIPCPPQDRRRVDVFHRADATAVPPPEPAATPGK
jgi:hypothetical protein